MSKLRTITTLLTVAAIAATLVACDEEYTYGDKGSSKSSSSASADVTPGECTADQLHGTYRMDDPNEAGFQWVNYRGSCYKTPCNAKARDAARFYPSVSVNPTSGEVTPVCLPVGSGVKGELPSYSPLAFTPPTTNPTPQCTNGCDLGQGSGASRLFLDNRLRQLLG